MCKFILEERILIIVKEKVYSSGLTLLIHFSEHTEGQEMTVSNWLVYLFEHFQQASFFSKILFL